MLNFLGITSACGSASTMAASSGISEATSGIAARMPSPQRNHSDWYPSVFLK
jgi:hypothetical protein